MVYLLIYRLLYTLLTINFKEFLSNILPIQKTAISLRLSNERLKNTFRHTLPQSFLYPQSKNKTTPTEVNIMGNSKLTSLYTIS